MITFLIALLCLVGGYFIYGSFVEKVFGPDLERKTPCYTKTDGADYIPMPTWKVYTVQFLNIAGTGPIFGALMGILYGPAAFFWIVLGCLIGGAMHDYMSGMISIRRDGASLPEIIGDELGGTCRLLMRIVSLVLMLCVGASFTLIPAGLMDQLTSELTGMTGTYLYWVIGMMFFYVCVTVFSISKIMGNIYPIFGVALLIMAVLVGFGIFTEPGDIPSIMTAFSDHYPTNLDPNGTPLFPALFITIACGAVSGFHATQSPMMARCIKNEKYGLRCFYGAMVTEGVVALIWAAASIKFVSSIDIPKLYGAVAPHLQVPYEKLYYMMTHTLSGEEVKMNPALVVNMICNDWLGKLGLVLAVLGIVAAPMSTGGSAFRAARLICADFTHWAQKTVVQRILLSVPLFLVAILMLNISSFKVLWLYVSWFNQVLATFTFFTIAHYLHHRNGEVSEVSKFQSSRWTWLISFFPAVFMCAVSSCFILIDKGNGFGMNHTLGYIIGLSFTTIITIMFLVYNRKK